MPRFLTRRHPSAAAVGLGGTLPCWILACASCLKEERQWTLRGSGSASPESGNTSTISISKINKTRNKAAVEKFYFSEYFRSAHQVFGALGSSYVGLREGFYTDIHVCAAYRGRQDEFWVLTGRDSEEV